MEIESFIDLYDSDMIKLRELGQHLDQKYAHRTPTKANLHSLAEETFDRCREIGLEVSVELGRRLYAEVFGIELVDPDRTVPEGFGILVEERTENSPFDPERMRDEVKRGVADAEWEKIRKRWKAAYG